MEKAGQDRRSVYKRAHRGVMIPVSRTWAEHARWLLRWRARNARSWTQWHLLRVRERVARGGDAYVDAFWDFHAPGDWEGLARAIIDEVPATSVLDVGCGAGTVLAAIARVQTVTRTHGLEHSPAARARAAAAGLMVDEFDAARLDPLARQAWRHRLGSFDLVTCFEVAEHLPARHGRRLVAFLSTWPRVLFSAAQPNQGGTLHVNEQPIAYWIREFAKNGMRVDARSDRLRARLSDVNVPSWYANNAVLLERAEGATT